MSLFLGIDAGGTHTRARLVDESGRVIGSGEAGPANTRIGLDRCLHEINLAWRAATTAAGLDSSAIAGVRAGLGIAGLNRRGMLPGLRAYPFPFETLAIASDAAIACIGAHHGEDGGIVVVGTGSIGFGRIGEEIVVVGGYGFPVSDEGSGADLGMQAIRRSLWARDGRLDHSPMTEAILAHFSGSAGEVITWTDTATARDYASFAPLVMDFAERGDAVAEPIVQECAHRIDQLIGILFDRGVPQCCLMGGLAQRIHDWLAVSVRLKLREPLGDPLSGAVHLARTRGLPPGQVVAQVSGKTG
ncbi:MAG: BadF/BadG/BcrA/BcrD ATPase family protein [Steroidobacteraceae bacterium]